jgi:hypothetical protein
MRDQSYVISPGRYHVTLTLVGRPTLHGWWGNEDVARSQVRDLVGQHGRPGTRITLDTRRPVPC